MYPNARIQLSVNRNYMERISEQLSSTDICEVFSPERVTSVCKQVGLVPGVAMDIKSG